MAPLTAPTWPKLQAMNWCKGYAGAGPEGAAPTYGKLSYPRKRVSSTPRPFNSITGGSGIAWRRPSRAQRVGILDHIGPAAGGRARGEQHEPRCRKYRRRKISAHRQIVRDILIGSIAQPRQRHVRCELPPLGIEPDALHQPL